MLRARIYLEAMVCFRRPFSILVPKKSLNNMSPTIIGVWMEQSIKLCCNDEDCRTGCTHLWPEDHSVKVAVSKTHNVMSDGRNARFRVSDDFNLHRFAVLVISVAILKTCGQRH